MASRNSALRACKRPKIGRAPIVRLQRALLRGCCLAPFALALLHCRPDFDSLSSGARAGAPSGGFTAFGGGGQTAGAGSAGERSQAGGGSAGAAQALGGSPA